MLLHAENNLQEEGGLQEVLKELIFAHLAAYYSPMDTGTVIYALLLSERDEISDSTADWIKLPSTYGNNTYCSTHPSQNYLNIDKYTEKQCAWLHCITYRSVWAKCTDFDIEKGRLLWTSTWQNNLLNPLDPKVLYVSLLEKKYIVSKYPTDNTNELNLLCKCLEETLNLYWCVYLYKDF